MSRTPLLDIFEAQVDTVVQTLYNTRANFGGRPANLYKENGKWITITYDDLVFKVENIAMGLMRLGIQPEDRVGIKAHTSARWTWADLGTIFAGACSVSLYPSLSRAETTAIINHSEAKAIFVDTHERVHEIMGYLDDMPTLKYIICLEKGFKGNGTNVFGLGEITYSGFQSRDALLPELKERHQAIKADTPCFILYTSGTMGSLKGVMHTHKGALYPGIRGYKHLQIYGHTQDYNTVVMCYLPLSHILEKINSYYGPLMLGALIGFGESPATLLTDISVIRPTWVMFVPRLLARIYLGFEKAFSATEQGKQLWDWAINVGVKATYALEDSHGRIDTTRPYPEQLTGELREEWIKAYNMVFWRIHQALGGRVRDFCSGGAYLDPELQRKFVGMGINVCNGYGLTETGAGIAEIPPNATKIGWISPANPTCEIKLDEDGEILCRGGGIITEYFKNDEANRECFTPDGWFRTGDIGEMDEDGYIRIIDRKKTILVLDTGKNVASGKIEALCTNSGLIEQAHIVGDNRKYIAALLVPNFDVIIGLFKSRGVPFDESKVKYGMVNGIQMVVEVGEDVISNQFLLGAVKAEIEKINGQLEDYETIKQFRLIPRRFLEELGEVTPSSKLKRKVIDERFSQEIEALFQ